MNRHFIKHSTGLRALLPALLASGTVVFALHAAAATLDLATAPLANSTTTTVKPNVMFVLDDSGSMTFTYMPDTVVNFHNNYGYQSNQCNSVYYNPAITYTPPKKADGTYFSNAVFTAAHDNGFDGTSNVTNLDNQFYANRFAPQSANTTYSGSSYKSYINYPLGQYSAVYYQYSGSATEKEYSDTNSTFYKECNSNFGSAPGSTVFSKRRLATTETTTISVSGSNSTSVSSIKVNGVELMSGSTTASSTASTVASTSRKRSRRTAFRPPLQEVW
jgi:type IV pilus assembly protein PilY1